MSEELALTPLHALHGELGARMVPFAGYSMPVQYPAGILKEHLHTRASASLFDVSHMGQVELHGANADAALEQVTPADVVGLADGKQRYGLLLADNGGILDDFMFARTGEHLTLVVNASRKTEDIAYLNARLGSDCEVRPRPELALLALQGPAAAGALGSMLDSMVDSGGGAHDLGAMLFMDVRELSLGGITCLVSRSGYTGEDGFEISVPAADAEALARALLECDGVAPAGLGARDSLRLEAGLCLYGHELDNETTPAAARLNWAIGKARRAGGERAGGFAGSERVLAEFEHPPARVRVGLRGVGRAPVRDGAALRSEAGNPVGVVTSGGFGPSVNGPVAMAFVERDFATPGQALVAVQRNREFPVEVASMPFVPPQYYR